MVNVVAEEEAVVEVTAVDLGLRAVLHLPHLPLLPPAPLQSQMPQPKFHFRCSAPASDKLLRGILASSYLVFPCLLSSSLTGLFYCIPFFLVVKLTLANFSLSHHLKHFSYFLVIAQLSR